MVYIPRIRAAYIIIFGRSIGSFYLLFSWLQTPLTTAAFSISIEIIFGRLYAARAAVFPGILLPTKNHLPRDCSCLYCRPCSPHTAFSRRPRSRTRCPLSLYCGRPPVARPHACSAILTLPVQAPCIKEASPTLRPSPFVLVPSRRLQRDKQILPRLRFPPPATTRKVLRSSRPGKKDARASPPESRGLWRIRFSHADLEGFAQI